MWDTVRAELNGGGHRPLEYLVNCLLSSWTSISRLLNSFSSLRIAAWGMDTHTHTRNDDTNAPLHRTHHRNTAVTQSNHIQSVTSHVDILSSLCILSINLLQTSPQGTTNNSWCNYCYVDRTWFKEVLARARLHVQQSKQESLLWVLLGQALVDLLSVINKQQ